MNRFRIRFEYEIEQANDEGRFEPFDRSTRTIDHMKRHQMKFVEGLLLDAANKMHAEGMKHPDVRGDGPEVMHHPVVEPLPLPRPKGKK